MNHTSLEEVAAFVRAEIMGNGQTQGCQWLHMYAFQRGHVVSKETIRLVSLILQVWRSETLLLKLYFTNLHPVIIVFLVPKHKEPQHFYAGPESEQSIEDNYKLKIKFLRKLASPTGH